LVFLDESGFLLVPSIVRTWAAKGKTPFIRVAGTWNKISAISALSLSPKQKCMSLYFQLHANKNIRTEQVVGFLRHLLRHLHGTIFLLWDRSRTHKARLAKQFLGKHSRIHSYFFPAYAPELNPDELVWSQLKRALGNSVPENTAHLRLLITKQKRRLQRSQTRLRSCLHASDLPGY
jgi:transposase